MTIIKVIGLGAALVWSMQSAMAAAELIIARDGKTDTVIAVSPEAGVWEKRAAEDLAGYIEKMTRARPRIANGREMNSQGIKAETPILFVGRAALEASPALKQVLAKSLKKDAVLNSDAIVVKREGSRVYLAGSNDDSHYYAATWLLQKWGCRWYMPTAFGECIPEVPVLSLGDVDMSYAPPFEVRGYWLAWNASVEGMDSFKKHNFFNVHTVPSGHSPGLVDYVSKLIPEGKTAFDVPIAEQSTIDHVASQVADIFAKGENFSLGMDDGMYRSDSPRDETLRAGLWDKYFLMPTMTDNFMALYNGVAAKLIGAHPQSRSKIGFLAYSNITIPPQRKIVAEKPLIAYLAPIDIDPIHGIDSIQSPARQEYGAMLKKWAEVMQGRVIIYDYDQSMLVWRDIPNPSHMAFAQDVRHYRDAGILGIDTESRGATATVFLNLYLRGQLMWNPDADVDGLLKEFYPKFYGPAAAPMERYWSAIYDAWKETISTEHEHFIIPAVYTPDLVKSLEEALVESENAVAPLRQKTAGLTGNEKLFLERMNFTRLGFDALKGYVAMITAANRESDYKAAVEAGVKGLAARMELAKMNPTFTTRVAPDSPAAETPAGGPAWWEGEVEQYRKLLALTDGSQGTLIKKLPLEWDFHRDPHDTGMARGWAYSPVDLSYWKNHASTYTLDSLKDYPIDQWERLRTDVYMQAQGIRHPDRQSFTGYAWYRTEVDLDKSELTGNAHLMFPGIFNDCWLYVNGELVAYRKQNPMWWNNDYDFQWNVDLAGKLHSGVNSIAVRVQVPHHFGGIFRRPFLYRTAATSQSAQ